MLPHQNVRSPPEHFAIDYIHNDNLLRGNIALQYVIQNNCRKVWWCFVMISCTFWGSRKKKVEFTKTILGFKLVIPKTLFERSVIIGSLFRRLIILGIKVRYSEGSLFWELRFVIPKVRYSKGPLFRRFLNPKMNKTQWFIVMKVRYSEGSLIWKWKRFCYSEAGPDLGEGRVGSCPGAPTKRGPHKLLLYFFNVLCKIRYKVNKLRGHLHFIAHSLRSLAHIDTLDYLGLSAVFRW